MNETTRQFATRMGYTWPEWKALPQAERDRLVLADVGHEQTPEERDAAAIFDLPVEQRLAALHAALGLDRA